MVSSIEAARGIRGDARKISGRSYVVNDKPGLSTRCVHSGEMHDPQGSPHTPLYSTPTFAFGSTAELLDVVEGRKAGNLYTRYGLNPTIRSLEEKLAALEGAEAAFAFSSGMAAGA